MAQVVSTGQITIVDNNDARPITAFVTASGGTQQIYSKDESSVAWVPSWASTPNVLTAKVYVGGAAAATEVAAQLTSRKWSTDLVTSLGAGTTLTVNTNLDPAVLASKVYYFEGDYTDPITGLVSHIIAQITLTTLKTGTNAVYLLPRGTMAIQESDTATKNVAVVCVDLMRAAGIDTSSVTYQFYEANGVTQIVNTMTTKYGLKTTAAGAAPTGSAAEINVNLPAAAAWSAHNTLVIHESAVADMGVYRAVAKDADGTQYQCYFTIMDASDPYQLNIISTSGDKLQNGVGSTNLYPIMYNGAAQLSVANTAAWTFLWSFYDGVTGNKAGFIDTTRTSAPSGRTVSANTAGAGSVLTYDGAAIAFAAGDMIKLQDPASAAVRYFEVASGTTVANLTLRAAIVSTFLNAVWPTSAILLNQFAGWNLFVCSGTGATAGTKSSTGTGAANYITVTGYEIDGKGTIMCDATRP